MQAGFAIVLSLWSLGFRPGFVDLFEHGEYHYTGGGYREVVFRYRLFVPEIRETRADKPQLPLVVWLHGMGEAGSNNLSQLKWLDDLMFHPPFRRSDYPFFLLACQCPIDNPRWLRVGNVSDNDDMVNVVAEIIASAIQEYPIDPERVSLVGVSDGGTGCWQLASRHPDLFAAVAPLGSAGNGNEPLENVVTIPVWAFHSRRDRDVPIMGVQLSTRALADMKGIVCLTELDSAAHDCWSIAFEEYGLLEWLLAQRRGSETTPPRVSPLRIRLRNKLKEIPWARTAQVSLPCGLLLMAWIIAHRRLRASKAR